MTKKSALANTQQHELLTVRSEGESAEARRKIIQGCGMLTIALHEMSARHHLASGVEGITDAEVIVHGNLYTPGLSFAQEPTQPRVAGNILFVEHRRLLEAQNGINRRLGQPQSSTADLAKFAYDISSRELEGVRYDGILRYRQNQVDYASYAGRYVLMSFLPEE